MTEPTNIADAITAAQGRVADCYTAISNQGGTLPTTQNLANMPTAINSIPSGGGSTKYGASTDTFLGNVDADGVLQQPTEQSDLVFTGVKDIVGYGLIYKFYETYVKSVSFPDLEEISGNYGCYHTFNDCQNLTSISLPNLTTVSGSYGCNQMFYNCSNLTSISLPNLTTINGSYGCNQMFYGCSSLTSISFPKLTTISQANVFTQAFRFCSNLTSVSFEKLSVLTGASALNQIFYGCTELQDVYFNALTTTSFGTNINQFNSMLNNTSSSVTHTLHFPSNLQSTISGLTGYPTFGGTSGYVTLAFDLPATT